MQVLTNAFLHCKHYHNNDITDDTFYFQNLPNEVTYEQGNKSAKMAR